MNINQALKEKNRIAGRLKVLDSRIATNASWIKGNVPAYNYYELLQTRIIEMESLISIKERISKATVPVVEKILRMGELKTLILTLRSSGASRGRRTEYGVQSLVEYESAITEKEKDVLIEGFEKEISQLQDDLDQFNATTNI